ncbi:MAG: hypothetical protein R3F54_05840 [Alphaproteobacteria bacterium]
MQTSQAVSSDSQRWRQMLCHQVCSRAVRPLGRAGITMSRDPSGSSFSFSALIVLDVGMRWWFRYHYRS